MDCIKCLTREMMKTVYRGKSKKINKFKLGLFYSISEHRILRTKLVEVNIQDSI